MESWWVGGAQQQGVGNGDLREDKPNMGWGNGGGGAAQAIKKK